MEHGTLSEVTGFEEGPAVLDIAGTSRKEYGPMNRIAPFTLAALLVVGATSVVAAQTPTDTTHKAAPAYRRTVPDSLVKLAKVSEDSARGLAMTRVPSGTLQAVMLQRLRGKLVWSFVIRDPAKAGNTEVYVDAVSGGFIDPTQKASS